MKTHVILESNHCKTHPYLPLHMAAKNGKWGREGNPYFSLSGKLVCNPFCVDNQQEKRNGNVKRGLAIRHHDLANLTGEKAERKGNRMGKGVAAVMGITFCINCLTIGQCMFIPILGLIHSFIQSFNRLPNWQQLRDYGNDLPETKKSTATATLWHRRSVSFYSYFCIFLRGRERFSSPHLFRGCVSWTDFSFGRKSNCQLAKLLCVCVCYCGGKTVGQIESTDLP